MIGSTIACVKRFVATFFVARFESVPADDSVRGLGVVSQPRCLCYVQCAGPVGAPRGHRHLSFVTLELWEPGVASSRKHQRSCRCTASVATSRSSARLNRTHLPFIPTGTSTTSSMNDTSTIFWISWMVGTVSARRGGSQQYSGSS